MNRFKHICFGIFLVLAMTSCGDALVEGSNPAEDPAPSGGGAATANPGGRGAAGEESLLPDVSGNPAGKPAGDDSISKDPAVPTDPSIPAEPEEVAFEGEACVPKIGDTEEILQAGCDDGLACLPDIFVDTSKGHCRIPCFTSQELEDGRIETTKKPELCPSGRTCLTITSEAGGGESGDYCVVPQTKRDSPCRAVDDEAECGAEMSCLVTNIANSAAGTVVFSACKPTCDMNSETPDAGCEFAASGDVCSNAPFAQEMQKTEEEGVVYCTMNVCEAQEAECECHLDKGYECTPYIPGIINVCMRNKGWCGTPIAWLKSEDLDGGFSGEICNEVEEHKYCDERAWKGVENPGNVQCVGISNNNSNGICFAICSYPTIDTDLDGAISDDEKGKILNCPDNYECKQDLGRKLGMIKPIEDKTHASGLKVCDASKCTAETPCPEQCGAGDAECLQITQQDGSNLDVCAAAFGNCEAKVVEEVISE